MAEVAEVGDLGLVGSDGWGEGLVGFVGGEEFAEVERPVEVLEWVLAG